MNGRCLATLSAVLAVFLVMPGLAAGQRRDAGADGSALDRTPWGDPDLQGVWSFATITPLERPSEFAGREHLTDAEVTALNLDALTRGDEPPPPGNPGAYNAFWFARGESTGRTALIVDPPDGRLPPLTSNGLPAFDPLRSDPRFGALLQRMNFPSAGLRP